MRDRLLSPSRAMRALRRQLAWAFLFSGGLNLLYFAPSLFMMQVYDRVLPTRGLATLVALSIVAIVAVAMIGLVDWVRGRVMLRAARLFDTRMAAVAAETQLGMGLQQRSASSIAPMRALETVRNAVAAQHILPVMDAPWTPLFIFATAMIHPVLCLIVTAGIFLALVPAVMQKRPSGLDTDTIALTVQEYEWSQADAVRALGMSRAMAARYERQKFRPRSNKEDPAAQGSALASVSRSLRIGLQMTVLAAGAALAIDKQISPGALIAASILSSRALAPIEQMAQAWRPTLAAMQAWRALKAVAVQAEKKEQPSRLPQPSGRLEFDNVSLALQDGKPLLSQIRFEIEPGEIVGVVGASGVGKSSLARAAVGALEANEGVVRVDGTDVRRWDRDWLGRHVGYVPQDVALFSGTIVENISRFEEVDPDERLRLVVEAAKASGAHEMISRLPTGYDTLLGPNGRGLSFGQAQRLALARALYRNPPLLILDEPNSHLDNEGESNLMEALRNARSRGAACLVVAHRMAVMSVVDRALIVRDGRVDRLAKEDLFTRRVVLAGQRGGT